MKTTLIKNAHIISPDIDIPGGAVLIEGTRIRHVYRAADALPDVADTVDLGGAMLMPGFIDIHAHGRSGYEVTDADPAHLGVMRRDKLREGVTTWLPTTLTLGADALADTLRTIADDAGCGVKIPGVHLEGPYINPHNLGAQNPDFVRLPDIDEVMRLQHIFPVFKMSYAVEVQGGAAFADALRAIGVVPSCAHSSATYEQFLAAHNFGLRNLTHFCNQMTPLHHRDIGLVGAGLLHDDVFIEIICDKIHLSPPMIELIFKLKNIDHILLITDACEAAGMPDGEYEIGGLPLVLRDNAARLKSTGALAGSVLQMNRALRNVRDVTGLPLPQLVKTTSFNQAQSLGLDALGKIEPGFIADLVALDADFEVRRVWVDGELTHH